MQISTSTTRISLMRMRRKRSRTHPSLRKIRGSSKRRVTKMIKMAMTPLTLVMTLRMRTMEKTMTTTLVIRRERPLMKRKMSLRMSMKSSPPIIRIARKALLYQAPKRSRSD